MKISHAAFAAVLAINATAAAQTAPAPRNVSLTTQDGTKLAATYYAAAKPGPAVLLLHMCNTTRKSWEPLGPELAAAGIHALAVDYRGFGESGGDRFDAVAPQDAQRIVNEKWPGDIDAAYSYLLAQPGVEKTRVGVAGGSCGVVQAIRTARRHPEVRSLALLAGPVDPDAIAFLTSTSWLPVFAAAAADDQYDPNAPRNMEWTLQLSGNPRNKLSTFKDGRHGTEIFIPHPELVTQMVAWYTNTLITRLADPRTTEAAKETPVRRFWRAAASPNGVPDAVRLYQDYVKRGEPEPLFPEAQLNLLGYYHLQAGRTTQAIELFKLNTVVFSTSANAFDSLGDGYLAAGQNDLALKASEKALELLPNDRSDDARKKAIRASVDQKIAKLKK